MVHAALVCSDPFSTPLTVVTVSAAVFTTSDTVQDFKLQNIVGSCDVKFPIRLEGLAYSHGHFSSVSLCQTDTVVKMSLQTSSSAPCYATSSMWSQCA